MFVREVPMPEGKQAGDVFAVALPVPPPNADRAVFKSVVVRLPCTTSTVPERRSMGGPMKSLESGLPQSAEPGAVAQVWLKV